MTTDPSDDADQDDDDEPTCVECDLPLVDEDLEQADDTCRYCMAKERWYERQAERLGIRY